MGGRAFLRASYSIDIILFSPHWLYSAINFIIFMMRSKSYTVNWFAEYREELGLSGACKVLVEGRQRCGHIFAAHPRLRWDLQNVFFAIGFPENPEWIRDQTHSYPQSVSNRQHIWNAELSLTLSKTQSLILWFKAEQWWVGPEYSFNLSLINRKIMFTTEA